jgi:hypothetical protein
MRDGQFHPAAYATIAKRLTRIDRGLLCNDYGKSLGTIAILFAVLATDALAHAITQEPHAFPYSNPVADFSVE